MSSTRTVPPKTKSSTTSRQTQDRIDRHSRRNAFRAVALAKEAARKEEKLARSDLARLQRESLSLETRIAQLKAAISQNCPSSDNLQFQTRLLQAEDRQRDLALQTDSARSRAFPRSTHPSTTMPPKQSDLVKAEDALRTGLLKEFQALKESATAENTDADAWNVINNTTPEELTSTILGHLDRYETLTQDYAAFTHDITEGKVSRREARSSASELRDRMQTIKELLSNLNDSLGGVAPVLADTCADVLSDLQLGDETLQKVATASRLDEPQSIREEEDSRDILSSALSTLSTGAAAVTSTPSAGGFFRESLAPGSSGLPVTWPQPAPVTPAPAPRAQPKPVASLPGLPTKPQPSSIYTQAGDALSNPRFAPDTSFSANWNRMSAPFNPPRMYPGHAPAGGGGTAMGGGGRPPNPPGGGGGGGGDPGGSDPGDDGEGDDLSLIHI